MFRSLTDSWENIVFGIPLSFERVDIILITGFPFFFCHDHWVIEAINP